MADVVQKVIDANDIHNGGLLVKGNIDANPLNNNTSSRGVVGYTKDNLTEIENNLTYRFDDAAV